MNKEYINTLLIKTKKKEYKTELMSNVLVYLTDNLFFFL